MSRLDLELQRLYGMPSADGRLRTLVLDLRAPADWPALARVWQAVQADLDLPAPAIAVNGADGFQLWFSLAVPVPAAQGAAFLEGLCRRHLADLPARRLRLLPGSAGWQPGPVPAPLADQDHWSAFVAQDLAPMFAETPWLDIPPNPDGQAALLATLRSTPADAWQQALQVLGLPPPAGGDAAVAGDAAAAMASAAAEESAAPVALDPPVALAHPAGVALPATADPRQFLLAVMNHPAVPLALRVDAAKALLAAGPGPDAQVPQ